jgi:hypothetical protein
MTDSEFTCFNCDNYKNCKEKCETCVRSTFIKPTNWTPINHKNKESDCYSYMKKQMDESLDLYRRKNETYGNSFGKSIEKYGLIAGLTRISDKFNRAENLILGAKNEVVDESLSDTLIDMANYCFMLAYEVDKRKDK